MLTFGSLFAGVGGIDLGLERAGLRCVWQVEHDGYAQKILAKHWPQVPKYRDVRYFLGGKRWRRVCAAWYADVICGGFPCTDISNAGRRAGIDGRQSGLWREYARIVRLLRPRYVLVENVPALTVRGLERVLGDLAALGYDAEWSCLPAAAVGAPHARWRLFLIADRRPGALDVRGPERDAQAVQREAVERGEPDGADAVLASDAEKQRGLLRATKGKRPGRFTGSRGCDDAPNSDSGRSEMPQQVRSRQPYAYVGNENASPYPASRWAGQRWRDEFAAYCESQGRALWQDAQSGICRGFDGISPLLDRVANRVDRLRCLGNAVLPQLVEWIGRRIVEDAKL